MKQYMNEMGRTFSQEHSITSFSGLTAIKLTDGDAESRSHWVTYALGITATSVFGTKGAGSITKSGTTTAKSGAAAAKQVLQMQTKKCQNWICQICFLMPRNTK